MSADIFCRYIEYKMYMNLVHPRQPRLSYRDWLDFGHRQ